MKRAIFLLSAMFVPLLTSTIQAGELTPQQKVMHVLNRLAYGPRPGDADRVMQMGVERYIDEQLHPQNIAVPPSLQQQLGALRTLNESSARLIEQYRDTENAVKNNVESGKEARREFVTEVVEDAGSARLARAILSPRQLEEMMVDFWFNHFNVFEGKGLDRVLVAAYEREAIRPYVFGKYRDLLGATAKHPAMLFYLDNWLSTTPGFKARGRANFQQGASGLNENYARELMELHTLGVDGGYTQTDVTELARILTGWTFDPRNGEFRFVDRRHDQGNKHWMGQTVRAQGQAEGEHVLDVLAVAPATARHISYQLAQYFVTDTPSPILVDRLTQRFKDSDGDIRIVLQALFQSPEFWDSATYGKKFKTPYRYVVSVVRAADVSLASYRPLMGTLRQLGMPLYGCQTPDGYKNTEDAWLNSEAISHRINFATALASGRLNKYPNAANSTSTSAPGKAPDSAQMQDDKMTERPIPVDVQRLKAVLNDLLSSQTSATIASTEPRLQAAMMLGSPDFMRH